MEEVLKKLYDAVLEGDFDGVKTNVQASLDAGLEPGVILNDGMIAAMREVGDALRSRGILCARDVDCGTRHAKRNDTPETAFTED
jgi:methanogenic corrinoid protein MtbC1